jgi:hypothetical protein
MFEQGEIIHLNWKLENLYFNKIQSLIAKI